MDDKAFDKTSKILWFAFLGSLWLYWMIAFALSKDGAAPGTPADLSFLKWLFLAAGALPILMIAVLRKLVFDGTIKPGPIHAGRSQLKRNTVIVSYAFAETPAIFGLILFFFSRRWEDFYLFLSFSAAAMIYFYPRGSTSST